jgi:hypothetical protein
LRLLRSLKQIGNLLIGTRELDERKTQCGYLDKLNNTEHSVHRKPPIASRK